MIKKPHALAFVTAAALSCALVLGGCSGEANSGKSSTSNAGLNKESIEQTLSLANNENQEWTYSSDAGAWTLSVVTAVANPEIEDEQGVSVCVPAAYVTGIDTDADGTADVTADSYSDAVKGALVIDAEAQVTSTNGQVYTAETAPVIVNTGAAGYSEQQNQTASSEYAAEGYVNVACGNRGKQSTLEDGTYTGDAPSCLVDQKNAVRYVKYNILLGNLPGNVDYFVSTGGSGGGAHAAMLAATSNNSDFYAYEAEASAVGVYKNDDGTYSTTVSVDGKDYELSDGMWGCVAYSAITSLAEGDMTMAFEYFMDTSYDFNTSFQKQLAEYLSTEYMEYINSQNLAVKESEVGFDLNGDGDKKDNVALTIEYDTDKYADTNGYGGTYLNLYLAEFQQNLEEYLDKLDYGTDWTWFDEDGKALSDSEVANMSSEDKAQAFIEGRYAKGESAQGHGGMGGPGGGMGRGFGNGEKPSGNPPSGNPPADGNGGDQQQNGQQQGGQQQGDQQKGGQQNGQQQGDQQDGQQQGGQQQDQQGDQQQGSQQQGGQQGSQQQDGQQQDQQQGDQQEVGTPDAGTTQASGNSSDSSNYSSYADMVSAYQEDIAEIEAGDEYGNNIVELYNPLNYIGAEGTSDPTWTRVVMGASEGDMSMFASLNMQIAWLNAGTDATVEWQWDGGHVPSEILGDSLALYVDQMYGEHVDGAKKIEKAAAEKQTTNGSAEEATGTDISSWVSYDDGNVSFELKDAAAYRTAGAAKAIPGFDTIDYGQEDYVFGSSSKDARHWDKYVLQALEDNAATLEPLFNASN